MTLTLPKFVDSSDPRMWVNIVKMTLDYTNNNSHWNQLRDALSDSFAQSSHKKWIQDILNDQNMNFDEFLRIFEARLLYTQMENARDTINNSPLLDVGDANVFVEKLQKAFCELYDANLWRNCPMVVELIIPLLYNDLKIRLKEHILEKKYITPDEAFKFIQMKHRELKERMLLIRGENSNILPSPSPSPTATLSDPLTVFHPILPPTPIGPRGDNGHYSSENGNTSFDLTQHVNFEIRKPLIGTYDRSFPTMDESLRQSDRFTPLRSDTIHFDSVSVNGSFPELNSSPSESLSDGQTTDDINELERTFSPQATSSGRNVRSTPRTNFSDVVSNGSSTCQESGGSRKVQKNEQFKPTIIGYYSIENDKMSLDKKTLPILLNEIRKLKFNTKLKTCYNLTDGYDEKLDVKMAPGISDLLTYLCKTKNTIDYKVHSDSRPLPFDFVTMCGVLVNIMTLPYKKDFNQVIYVQKFQGTIYLATFAYDRMLDKETFSGLRFEKYAAKSSSKSTNYHNHFNCLTKTQIGKYNVLYNTKMDAVKEETANLYDTNSYVEFKTKHQRYAEADDKLLGSMMQWWARCHISGVNEIVCGYKNDQMYVNNIVKYNKKEIEEKTKKSKKTKPFSNTGFSSGWDMNFCMSYLKNFLEHIHRVMHDMEELKVYGFIGKCNEDNIAKAWNHREMNDKEILTQDFILNFFPATYDFIHVTGRKRKPCVIVKNVHTKLNSDELLYHITHDNDLNLKAPKDDIAVKFINHSAAFAVLEVTPDVYPILCSIPIVISKETCNTEKFTYITQCTKCFKYFHTNEFCCDEKTCSHCAESHMYSECPHKDDKEKLKCCNCHAWNISAEAVKQGFTYATNHTAINRYCPIRDRLRNIIDAITDYRDSNV